LSVVVVGVVVMVVEEKSVGVVGVVVSVFVGKEVCGSS